MWLIYFTIGGNADYAKLLEMSIKSLRENCKDDSQIDIMIMCDSEYIKHVEHLHTKLHITPTNVNGVQSSMRKIEIFDFPDIHKYQAVLYLDCDIVVCGDIRELLSKIHKKNILYTLAETDADAHTKIFYGLQNYNTDEFAFLIQNKIPAFNCGQFAFIPDEAMKKHFIAVQQSVKTHTGISFYEQSFMNRHFNLYCQQDHEVFGQFGLLYPTVYVPKKMIVHFIGIHKTVQIKLSEMQKYYQSYQTYSNKWAYTVFWFFLFFFVFVFVLAIFRHRKRQ